jgi:hypothetical protein
MSPRHLSFVETCRSKPSPELLVVLADRLDVPLRERTQMLQAAGYAPATRRRRSTTGRCNGRGRPCSGCSITTTRIPGWRSTGSATWSSPTRRRRGSPRSSRPQLAGLRLNVLRACLHPVGFAPGTLNFPEWARYVLGELRQLAVRTAGPQALAMLVEASAYPTVVALGEWRRWPSPAEPALLVPWRIDVGGRVLSFFTTLTSFGTPADVTLAELAVELSYPADEETEAALVAAH